MSVAAPSTEIAPGIHRLELGMEGFVNAVVIEGDDDLTLFDAGFADDRDAILGAIGALGYEHAALRRIVVSHAHFDHVGCAAALREATGAEILMTRADAELVASGFCSRGLTVKAGFEQMLARRTGGIDLSAPMSIEPFEVDAYLEPGEAVPGFADAEVVATPGHCAGQVVLLLHRHGGIAMTADAVANFDGVIGSPVMAEDLDVAERDFHRLAERDFEVAVFGHGAPMLEGASAAFRAVASTGA